MYLNLIYFIRSLYLNKLDNSSIYLRILSKRSDHTTWNDEIHTGVPKEFTTNYFKLHS